MGVVSGSSAHGPAKNANLLREQLHEVVISAPHMLAGGWLHAAGCGHRAPSAYLEIMLQGYRRPCFVMSPFLRHV